MKNNGIFVYLQQPATVPRPMPVPVPMPSPSSFPTPSGLDRHAAQATGMRLRNLLKLPKAHKWVCYEWFYSNIDAYVKHFDFQR